MKRFYENIVHSNIVRIQLRENAFIIAITFFSLRFCFSSVSNCLITIYTYIWPEKWACYLWIQSMHSMCSINDGFNESAFLSGSFDIFKSILLSIMMMIMRPSIQVQCYSIDRIHLLVNVWIVVELSLAMLTNEKCLYFIKLLEWINRCKLLLYQFASIFFHSPLRFGFGALNFGIWNARDRVNYLHFTYVHTRASTLIAVLVFRVILYSLTCH